LRGRLRIVKKIYVKPMIAVEHYSLSQAIATCTTKIGFMDSECVKKDPDATDQMKDLAWAEFFNAGHCESYPEGMDGADSICYHTNLNAAFNS